MKNPLYRSKSYPPPPPTLVRRLKVGKELGKNIYKNSEVLEK
jgi:hypothetical protein